MVRTRGQRRAVTFAQWPGRSSDKLGHLVAVDNDHVEAIYRARRLDSFTHVEVAKWQTRQLEGLVPLGAYGFKSRLRHQKTGVLQGNPFRGRLASCHCLATFRKVLRNGCGMIKAD